MTIRGDRVSRPCTGDDRSHSPRRTPRLRRRSLIRRFGSERGLAARPAARSGSDAFRAGRASRLPLRDRGDARGRLDGRARAGGPRRPAGRDHRARPTRKMMINALNSGASVFMADFEDALSPPWDQRGQRPGELHRGDPRDAHVPKPRGQGIPTRSEPGHAGGPPRGLAPRGERISCVDGRAAPASLFDFGLYFFHNARELLARGSGPYFYLPKLESHLEARLWNEVFDAAQDALDIPRGTIRATVLIETIVAAFEMDEILYELRAHAAGLNAGRWDYIFSIIKKLGHRSEFILPDRAQVTMSVPFMEAYTELLVQTCHRRRAPTPSEAWRRSFPSRRDAEVNRVALAAGARGQGARGEPRFRRRLGGPSRPGAHRARGVRQGAGRQAASEGSPARGGMGGAGTAAGRADSRRPDHRGRSAGQRRASRCSTSRRGSGATVRSPSTT